MTNEIIPQSIQKQEVSLTLKDLLQLTKANQPATPKSSVNKKDFIRLADAKYNLEVMSKCYTKAKQEITDEVELGLLDNSISDNAIDKETATTINARLEQQVKNNYLPESTDE